MHYFIILLTIKQWKKWITFKFNWIEEKSYANWCRRYWKSTLHFIVYNYVVEKKLLKKQKYGKIIIYIPFKIYSILVIIYFFKMKLINPIIIPPISTLIATPWLELIGWFLSNSLIVWILSFTLKKAEIFVHVPW